MLATLTNRTYLLLAAAIVLLAGSFVIFASATRDEERRVDPRRCPNARPATGGASRSRRSRSVTRRSSPLPRERGGERSEPG